MSAEFVLVKVKEVAEIYSGNSINEKLKDTKYTGLDSGVDYISTKDIGFDSVINYDNGVKIPYEELQNFKKAPKDTVFICAEGGSAGRKIAISDRELCFVNKLFATVARSNVLPKFLYYYFKSEDFIEQFKGSMTGIIGGVSINKFKELNVKLPPISTQQKIVTKLDAIFDEIDKATAAAEANAKNAEALFQSYLTEVFERGGKEWIEHVTGDVCSNITDGKHGDCRNDENSGYYFLSAKDIKNGVLNYLGARQINKEDFEETHRRTNLEYGDVLVTNSGTIGRMAIADNDERTRKTTFQKSVAILKPMKNIVDSKFLFHLLTSKLSHFNNISAGAAQKNLLLRDIRSLKIRMPKELTEQKLISNRFDSMRNQVDRMKDVYKTKTIEVSNLKQSILKKAFSGELVKE